ncbi:MAG TPA: HAMP domain-containing sensor histidine kinase [Gaiellaceae bacterium]
MLGSLRVRLPLIFLAGIVLATVVSAAIAIRLFQTFSRGQTVSELRREAAGIAQLYSTAIRQGYGNKQDRAAPEFAAANLERATNTRLFWAGPKQPFPGQNSDLQRFPGTIDWTSGQALSFDLKLNGRSYFAVAKPVELDQGLTIGAIVVAKRKADVGESVNSLMARLAIAAAVGVLVAGLLAWYLSRRLVRPVLQLSRAADRVAGGDYDVDVPPKAPGELGHLSERFGEMADRLAEVERMERNFLMSVSHELRTPLTAIRGHVSALLEGVVDDPELETASLQTVEAEAQRLERLVGDILDLAKLDTHRFTVMREEVDMGQLLDRAYETYRDEARRRSIEYEREVHDRPVILSDGDRVLQIVGNLISNAFHATPDGGRVGLELTQLDGTVRVAVEDSGPGIPAEKRERLFRPFVSESGGGGTGLGLAIAKELSVALGGRIELRSEVGVGSRFELVLPASSTPRPPAQPASAVGSR